MATTHKAVFYDRDGIINTATPRGTYMLQLEDFQLLPGIHSLMQAAQAAGYQNIVVTNQPAIGKGLLSPETLEAMHQKMRQALPGLIDGVYYCPHTNTDQCACRKPQPGMLQQAMDEHGIQPQGSWMIGDSDKDILAGEAAGVRTIFLRNDYNLEEQSHCSPDYWVDSLEEVPALLSIS